MTSPQSQPTASEMDFDPLILEIVHRVAADAQVCRVTALTTDSAATDDTSKGAGYGAPLRIDVRTRAGSRSFVLHTALSNSFGHDRRSDRASDMLLANDTCALVPRHVKVLDVGAYRLGGGTISVRDTGEFYTLTEYVEGTRYADDLRRIAMAGKSTPVDLGRMVELAVYLADLHGRPGGEPPVYARAIRDLLGGGEGIFGTRGWLSG